ncbi:M16 family metallopeptidase [Carboxylicivirga linearis]|uniref:Insulinase family protein n=1 Tax=Carboxylicivirga linearis TaxID=1628157 RepID=A0ABS5JVA8_9BACT|nr:pitrilysin family protein [Carboxylicivirga linearis]MBS2098817.1 insulinase family protein [Carboxylicivirga linearis]
MNNRFSLLAFLFIIAGLGSVNAQLNKINFEEFDLDNGLHVILHQDKTTPNVTVSVMYNVGSKHESPDRTGFAHFFEHLMFEGTENIDRGQYFKIVQNAGGTLNANTSSDRTYYYETLPSNQLELGLWLESERMLHAKVDSLGIATQKKVVIEEKKQSYDNRPYGTILQETMKRAFTEHPYRWTTIGDPEHIMAAKDEEFQQFYNKFYVPNNAVLVLAGDIEIDQAKEWIKKYFSDIPRGKQNLEYNPVVEPPLNGEVRDTVFDNVQLPLILQAYRTPAMGTDDYYALDMLSTLLSKGQSSRLYKSLVDDQQKAMQVASFPIGYKEPSLALTIALPNMGVETKDLEDAMDAEIKKVQDELISEKEFQKLKNQFENDIVKGNIRVATRANTLARNYTYFGNANLINTELDKYLAVTREDIQRVANKYLTKDNRVVLYYLPKSQQN